MAGECNSYATVSEQSRAAARSKWVAALPRISSAAQARHRTTSGGFRHEQHHLPGRPGRRRAGDPVLPRAALKQPPTRRCSSPSCSPLWRASTSWTPPYPKEDVDGRDKPDHDDEA